MIAVHMGRKVEQHKVMYDVPLENLIKETFVNKNCDKALSYGTLCGFYFIFQILPSSRDLRTYLAISMAERSSFLRSVSFRMSS
jgi:hypothetical protein